MRAGKRDKRIVVERRSQVRDRGTGELVETWNPIGELWAEMMQGRAAERYAVSQKIAEVTTVFSVDWSPGLLVITPDEHRVAWNGLTFDVKGCIEIQRRRGVAITVIARTEGLTAQGLEPEA